MVDHCSAQYECETRRNVGAEGNMLGEPPSYLVATSGYAVCLTMAALGAHVGAKLQRPVVRIRHHEVGYHCS